MSCSEVPSLRAFRAAVRSWYRLHGRDLPWRQTSDPYAILVSEFMLQQTQVERVRGSYPVFLRAFQDFAALAAAPQREVLAAWSGLGYNRRALNLQRTARRVVDEFGGKLPADPEVLATLPGIGPATAGAVAAFAFGRPVAFIETNIRTVFLHLFFPKRDGVRDAEILPLVAATLDRRDPRTWYYALMDYGVMLKREAGAGNARSAHHARQSPFEGSDRQVRGAILKTLLKRGSLTLPALAKALGRDEPTVRRILVGLAAEGFIRRRGLSCHLKD